MQHQIGIIDYGMGNLTSVRNAFASLEYDARILKAAEEIADVSHLVLPGVGAFADGMRNLREQGWLALMNDAVLGQGKPFLGICLGLQLLATTSSEHGQHEGLGWIPGDVVRLSDQNNTLRVPHIGWNDALPEHTTGNYCEGFEKPGIFYFVHSYHFQPADTSVVDGWCEYGDPFVASIVKDNISAVQFHPEKSQRCGLQVLKNFMSRSAVLNPSV